MFCRAGNKYMPERKRSRPNFLFRERTFLFRDLDCQPRSDSCLAEAVGRGWTVRPRLDSPDRGKCKFPQGKSIESERFSTSEHYFQAAWIYFLCFLAAQCLKCDLKFNAGDRDKPILNITLVRVSILDTNF